MGYGIIIIFGLVALAVQFMFERRRERIQKEYEQQRLEAEKTFWATRGATMNGMAKAMEGAINSAQAVVTAEQQRRAHEETAKQQAAAHRREMDARVDQRLAAQRAAGATQQQDAHYDARTDQWLDSSGKVVPAPRSRIMGMDLAKGPDRASYFNPDAFGTRIADPRQVGAGISTVDLGYETYEEARRRRVAVDSAMVDAQITGLGVVRMSHDSIEHVPAAQFRGGGGSFDGGGASGDYTPAASSCSSSSSSSDTSSSSSCSSSDSGGSSSSD